MDLAFERRRAWQEKLGEAPPRWAVVAVTSCAVGLLALPVAMTGLLVLARFAGRPVQLGQLGLAVFGVLWLGLFATAHVLISRYPRVPRDS